MDGRNSTTKEFIAWPAAFPSGTLAPTADFVHGLGMQLGTYTAESRGTCCGHEASEGYEAVDADTFARWGVDYRECAALLALFEPFGACLLLLLTFLSLSCPPSLSLSLCEQSRWMAATKTRATMLLATL